MRMSVPIIFLICASTLTLLAASSTAQSVLEKPVTVDAHNLPLDAILDQVASQAKVNFTHGSGDVFEAKVTIKADKEKLGAFLDKLFKDYPYNYTVIEDNIIVKDAPEKLRGKGTVKPPVSGKVVDEQGQPLPGVTIRIKKTGQIAYTNENGDFRLNNLPDSATLVFSFIGFLTQEVKVTGTITTLNISLKQDIAALKEVSVVSTGYQTLPKERATGSFEIVDNKLINRRISTNILDRLENTVPGIEFNRTTYAPEALRIRGTSTILAESSPLIVVDNLPFDGNVNDINPNDVESVTILKDAASASIWGARAGNGVIVLTTKKGKTPKPSVNFVSNITLVPRPDMSSIHTINSSDYIDLEKYLFTKGYYTSSETADGHPPLTPVVELLIASRDGKITAASANQQIDAMRNYNANAEIQKYLYRPTVNQQYQMNVSGQTPSLNYYFSTGLDNNPSVLTGDQGNSRITIRSNNTFQLTPKLAFNAAINYIQNNGQGSANSGINLTAGSTKGLYPYARLADDSGNPLTIIQNYRSTFVDQSNQKGLLNWNYSPIDDLNESGYKTESKNVLLKTSLEYHLFRFLNASVLYQYQNITSSNENFNGGDSYYTRNLVNRFTSINATTGALTRPIPLGDIRVINNSFSKSQQARAQLNYNQSFGKHEITALGGMEVRELKNSSNANQYYGYNPVSNTVVTSLNYTTQFPLYTNNSATAVIPNVQNISNGTIDHFWSYFANASYSYDHRYIISGSVRTDASNLFGVKTNQKGVPLWSTGLSWLINDEPFYHFGFVPQLKLRASYGIQGNFSRATAALTTASYTTTSTGYIYAKVLNPPNESLRWEKVKMFNLGLDFTLKNNLLNGSIEYFNKKSSDLMGTAPIDPTVGLGDELGSSASFVGNIANIAGHGFDIRLQSQNINKQLRWTTTALFSYVNMYVSKYFMPVSALGSAYLNSGSTNPIEGRPLYSILSYPWAGLDPATGDPQGYVNGVISKDYSKIVSSTALRDMVYSGNRTPNYYGSLRNDFYYRNFSLSVNVSFKAGYYFRRSSINYNTLFSRWTGSSDYALRWQAPGDERTTNVPSLVYPVNSNRDVFYTNSATLIQKGDHVRLEDITLGYDLNKTTIHKLPFNKLRLFIYANNLGILWRANKLGLDPNFLDVPDTGKLISFGLNVTL